MSNASLLKHVRRAVLTGGAVAVAVLTLAGPAAASEAGSTGLVATGGGKVNVRSGPSTSSKIIGTRPNRSSLTLLCQDKGQKINGHRRTTTMWNKVKGGGYVSDSYVRRGTVPPLCSELEKERAPAFTDAAAPSKKQLHPTSIPAGQSSFTPNAEQMRNARAIVETGRKLGLPPRAWVIAVATSLQESTLHNYGHLGDRNDHDSLGLFQQRPSMGWGTLKQVTDPEHASKRFYKKLTTVRNWSELPLTVAAQKVQVSGYPKAYAKWEKQAGNIVQAFYGHGPYTTQVS